MSVTIFPRSSPQCVRLTLPLIPGSTPSWRVVFPRFLVPVLTPQLSAGADTEGYFPICAVYLEACGCKPDICDDVTLFIDDGLSRCSVWVNVAEIIPPIKGGAPQPQSLDFRIKAAAAAVNSSIMHGSLPITVDPKLANVSPVKGVMAEVSGMLCTQFEVWARIPDGPTAMPVEVRFQLMVDARGSAPFSYDGFKDLPHLP